MTTIFDCQKCEKIFMGYPWRCRYYVISRVKLKVTVVSLYETLRGSRTVKSFFLNTLIMELKFGQIYVTLILQIFKVIWVVLISIAMERAAILEILISYNFFFFFWKTKRLTIFKLSQKV